MKDEQRVLTAAREVRDRAVAQAAADAVTGVIAQRYAQAGFDAAIRHYTESGELKLRPSTTTWHVERHDDGSVEITRSTVAEP